MSFGFIIGFTFFSCENLGALNSLSGAGSA